MDNYFITGFDLQDVIFASLTTAKRGGEIQALSRLVSFSSSAASLVICAGVGGQDKICLAAPPSLL